MSDYWRGLWFATTLHSAVIGIIVALSILFGGCALSTEPAACPAPPVGTYMAVHTVTESGCGMLGPYEAPVALPDGWWSGVDADASCTRERSFDPVVCEVTVATHCAWDGGSAETWQVLDLGGAPGRLAGAEGASRSDGCEDLGAVVMERLE